MGLPTIFFLVGLGMHAVNGPVGFAAPVGSLEECKAKKQEIDAAIKANPDVAYYTLECKGLAQPKEKAAKNH